MEDFSKKVKIEDNMEEVVDDKEIASLLRQFLQVQERRAQAYATLKKGFTELGDSAYQQLCNKITVQFSDCSKQVLALESIFLSPNCCRNDLASLLRSVQVQEKQKLHLLEKLLRCPLCLCPRPQPLGRYDVLEFGEGAQKICTVRSVYMKLLPLNFKNTFLLQSLLYDKPQTATIQVLKKAGRPSERLVSHENCKFQNHHQHECVHVHEITEAAGTEEAEADAEYDNAMKEAIQGVQDAVTTINEYLEEVRYEIAALEVEAD
ncbi:REX1-B-related protein [Tanacetum coccineum]